MPELGAWEKRDEASVPMLPGTRWTAVVIWSRMSFCQFQLGGVVEKLLSMAAESIVS